jgi:hypothetical protein
MLSPENAIYVEATTGSCYMRMDSGEFINALSAVWEFWIHVREWMDLLEHRRWFFKRLKRKGRLLGSTLKNQWRLF